MSPLTVFSPTSLAAFARVPAGTLIDVRSPAEFAEDHVPGAMNLPALSNAERAEVGTIYVQDSRFRARRIGAAYVARNVARYLEDDLANRDGAWQPLVYCWRGGQRSGAVATILAQIGWRTQVLEGGYRSYRRLVVQMLRDEPLPHRLILLDGNTGTAKTDLLSRLAERGVQVIDLEGLAGHRGSIFGAMPGGQPTQKRFESVLAQALTAADPARPVVLEAESNRIGTCNLPSSLWAAMRAAPRVEVAAPLAARARYLCRAYADLRADPEHLQTGLEGLLPFQGRARIDAWRGFAAAGDYETLAAELIAGHYDPRYTKARVRHSEDPIARLEVEALEESDLERLADRLAQEIARASVPRGSGVEELS